MPLASGQLRVRRGMARGHSRHARVLATAHNRPSMTIGPDEAISTCPTPISRLRPRQAADRRLRQPVHAADRAPRARGGRLLRNRAVPERRARLCGNEAQGGDPLRRPRLRARRRQSARAAGDLLFGRARARHLLRADDDGRAARRRSGERPSSRIRPGGSHRRRDQPAARGSLETRRTPCRLDEPWRPHHQAAAGICAHRRLRKCAVRADRRRGAPLLRPDVPSRGRAYARRRAIDPEFRPRGRGSEERLDDGRVPRRGARSDPRPRRQGPGDLRAVGRRRFRRSPRC